MTETSENGPITLTEEQHTKLMEFASQFNLSMQAAFIEMMDKMRAVEIDHPDAEALVGNYGPLALGAAIAAIFQSYEPGAEKGFWDLLLGKYHEGTKAFSEVSDQTATGSLPEGVSVIEVDPHSFQFSKMKH